MSVTVRAKSEMGLIIVVAVVVTSCSSC